MNMNVLNLFSLSPDVRKCLKMQVPFKGEVTQQTVHSSDSSHQEEVSRRRQGWNQESDQSWVTGGSAIKCNCYPSLRPAPWWSNPAPCGAVGFLSGSGSRMNGWGQLEAAPSTPPFSRGRAPSAAHSLPPICLPVPSELPQDSQGRDEPRLRCTLTANHRPVHSCGSGRRNYTEWYSKCSLIRQISCWELEQTILPLWEAAVGLQTESIC